MSNIGELVFHRLGSAGGLAIIPIAFGLAALACNTPSIKPEPFTLSGSWSLLHSVSELPVADRSGSGAIAVDAEWPRSTLNAALVFATEPPRTIEISDSGSAVVLSVGSGQSLLLYTDGRLSKEPIAWPVDCECQASWRGSVLFVEHVLEDRTHVVETYERSEDGKQLLVTVMIEDGRLPRPLTSRRLYGES